VIRGRTDGIMNGMGLVGVLPEGKEATCSEKSQLRW
jgi:hypothetical protein